eukprot:323837_1
MRNRLIVGVILLACSPVMLKGLILGGKMSAEWSSSRGIMRTMSSVKQRRPGLRSLWLARYGVMASVLSDLEELDSLVSNNASNLESKQADLNRLRIQAARQEWQRHDSDTGSPEVQIAMLTERIVYLTKHMQQNRKDLHSRRGLIALVSKRRDLLNYLYREDSNRCNEVRKKLGIRFRPKSTSRHKTREVKYAEYKNTKSKIGAALAVKREKKNSWLENQYREQAEEEKVKTTL